MKVRKDAMSIRRRGQVNLPAQQLEQAPMV